MIEYKQHLDIPLEYIKEKINAFLLEDMPKGDVTTDNIIPKSEKITANIQSVEELIFAGEKIIPHCFGSECHIKLYKQDGDLVNAGENIGEIQGPSNIILSRERVMLNLIQRLCGIASTAFKYVQLAYNVNVKILDTRKTTPGLRLFEKYAVTCGGGYNHRLDLSAGYLIKDNHLATTQSIEKIINNIKTITNYKPIEVEVDTIDQISKILPLGIDGFLLDNMSPNLTKECVQIIKKYDNNIFIESSGGITLNNIESYIDTGINAISVGALTHQAQNINIKLEFI